MSKLNLIGFEGYLTRRVRENTKKAYLFALREWDYFLGHNGKTPTQETAQEFIDYLEQLSKSNNSINIKANAIRRYFVWLKSPIKLDTPTMEFTNVTYLSKEQLDKLLGACRTPVESAVITLLMDLGCRKSELLQVELTDVDWDNQLVRVTRKGGAVDFINISVRGVEALKSWLAVRHSNSRRVFMDLNGYDIWWTVSRVGRRVKIKVTPHMLRHTRAAQMILDGAEPHIVQRHLGHKSIATTLNIYGRIKPLDYKDKIPSW